MNMAIRHLTTSLFAILALVSFLRTPVRAQAPTEPVLCKPDCFENDWTSKFNTYSPGFWCGATYCNIRVHYAYRTACPPQNYTDIQIYRIEKLDPGCSGCTDEELISTAVAGLLTYSSTPFEQPKNGECITTWRVSLAACWRQGHMTLPLFGTVPVLIPCEPEACCKTEYVVCRDDNGNKTIYPQTPRPNSVPSCGPEGGELCFSACSLTYVDFDKLSLELNTNRRAAETFNLSRDNQASISCRAFAASTVTLDVVDISGRVLLTQKAFPDADLRCDFRSDFSQLPTGSYLLRVTNENRSILTTSFQIRN